MFTINDLDPDALISRLAGPLSPHNRAAFRAAAEDALTRVPCWGEGAVYRAVLAPGMRVRVISGPLHDQIGLLAVLRPHERVLVLMHLLGGEQRVELARSAIEAV